jgi:hypothetical protein
MSRNLATPRARTQLFDHIYADNVNGGPLHLGTIKHPAVSNAAGLKAQRSTSKRK